MNGESNTALRNYFKLRRLFNRKKTDKSCFNWLIQIEAVNLDSSVFDTNQISIRRGGTIVIHKTLGAIRERIEAQFSGDVSTSGNATTISIGGSYLLLHFSGSDVHFEQAKSIIEAVLSEKDSKRVSFLTAQIALEENDNSTDINAHQLSQYRNRLTNSIRCQQGKLISLHSANLSVETPAKDSNAQYCDFDQLRPAETLFSMSKQHPDGDIETKVVSQYSKDRHHFGSQQKRTYILEALKHLPSNEEENLNQTDTEQNYSDIAFANDFKELSNFPNKQEEHIHVNNKVALLYFDGNQMHKSQSGLSANELITFDNELDKRKQAFLANLIKEFRLDDTLYETAQETNNSSAEKAQKILKLELLLWGGDEIMIAVPSWAGFRVLSLFYKAMNGLMAKEDVDITFASGLLIAPHNAPIKQLSKTVIALAEHSKTFTRTCNAVTPMLLESIDYPTDEISDFWRRRYQPLIAFSEAVKETYLGDLITPLVIPGELELDAIVDLKNKISDNHLNGPLRKRVVSLLSIPLEAHNYSLLLQEIKSVNLWAKREADADIEEVNEYFKILDENDIKNISNTKEESDTPNIDARQKAYVLLNHLQALVQFLEYRRYIYRPNQQSVHSKTETEQQEAR